MARCLHQVGSEELPGGQIRGELAIIRGGSAGRDHADGGAGIGRAEGGQDRRRIVGGEAAAEQVTDGLRHDDHVGRKRIRCRLPEHAHIAGREPAGGERRAHLRVTGDGGGVADMLGDPGRRPTARCRLRTLLGGAYRVAVGVRAGQVLGHGDAQTPRGQDDQGRRDRTGRDQAPASRRRARAGSRSRRAAGGRVSYGRRSRRRPRPGGAFGRAEPGGPDLARGLDGWAGLAGGLGPRGPVNGRCCRAVVRGG